MRLPGWVWRAYHRSANRVSDALARMSGACNATTWDGLGYAGGYAHWRCMKARGHEGQHRFNSYVWEVGPPGLARVSFEPLPVESPAAYRAAATRETPFHHVTARRYSIESRRRTRQRARAADEATRRHRAGR